MIKFSVPGVPVAQPRQRHRINTSKAGHQFVQNFTPRTGAVQDYKATVVMYACQTHKGAPPLEGPLAARITFYLTRPARLMGKKHPEGPLPCETKPDFDNLAKAVTDPLTGILWRDDKQLYAVSVVKLYHGKQEAPRTEFSVWQPAEYAEALAQ